MNIFNQLFGPSSQIYDICIRNSLNMELKYLGQGFEPESKNAVGNILSELFQNDVYDTFFYFDKLECYEGIGKYFAIWH